MRGTKYVKYSHTLHNQKFYYHFITITISLPFTQTQSYPIITYIETIRSSIF